MTHQVHKYILIGTHNSGKKNLQPMRKGNFLKKINPGVKSKPIKFSPY